MKIYFVVILLAFANLMASARIVVDKIDPPHWWVGMNDNTLQLQVYGKDIKSADVVVDVDGVKVDSVARLDGSDDYLFLYLNIADDVKPGDIPVVFKKGKKQLKINYNLRSRAAEPKGAQGFSAADVMYMIMPDRFADANPENNKIESMKFPVGANRQNLNVRHGGDIEGIMNHIDYIDSLGVTAVWVNPVLENDMPGGSYHGYATTDYYKVDPRLGSNEDYAAMIDALHRRGIKTVMDMIFNHCGSEHVWFRNRPSSDWFNFPDGYVQTNYRLSTITDPYASDYDKRLTVDGWFVEEMPDLNQNNPHLMKYLIQNSIWWIEEVGIDGIRMDTYPYADADQMGGWINAVKAEYPDFNIVGECWFAEPAGEAYWQAMSKLSINGENTYLPAIMDFPLMVKSRDMAPYKEQTDPWNGLNKIYDHLALDYIYPDPLQLLRFLDNHDTERFILEEPETLAQWKQAIALILTVPGIPQIYYGTELLMSGDRRPGDGNVRRDMPGGFPGDKVNAFTRHGRTDKQNEAFDFMSKILHWRKNSKAIAEGKMLHFMPTNGLYLYRRMTADDQVIVVLNGVDKENEVDMSRYKEIGTPGEKFVDVLTGETVELISTDTNMRRFSPRQIMILQKP